MENLGLILLATGLISLGGLIGIVSLAVNQKRLERALLVLVSLSAGALMGGAFLHLIPEAVENVKSESGVGNIFIAVLDRKISFSAYMVGVGNQFTVFTPAVTSLQIV